MSASRRRLSSSLKPQASSLSASSEGQGTKRQQSQRPGPPQENQLGNRSDPTYDWFVNSPSSAPSIPPAVPGTIPTFTIVAVSEDNTVTISAINFIPNDTYTVRMGLYGTKAVGGTWVASHSTGPVGTFTATYTIPAGLYGLDRIAIRLQSPTSGYYSYNWFWNADHP